MEAVRAFNNELSSLYETRPPVSRAKMASVTKHAIKAIKFYKHVVQSVEKFVQKCKPEYKVPGLYVIDSIVRQSRHQFGPEKDVFAPRFTKNIVSTFQNLFKCPPEEKCRVVRVLNLWQKNAVFPVEVIQPLLDLAAEPNNVDLVLAAQRAVEKVVSAHQRNSAMAARTSNGGGEASLIAQQSEIVNTVTKLLEQTGEGNLLATAQEGQLQQLQLLQQQLMMHTEMMSSKPQTTPPVLDSNLLAQIKLLTDQLLSKTSDSPTPVSHNNLPSSAPGVAAIESGSGGNYGGYGDSGGSHGSGIGGTNSGALKQMSEPGFNRKLLDFDYGDSDEEEERKEEGANVPHSLPGEVQNILNDPSIMQRIQQMSASLQNPEQHHLGGVSQDMLRKQHLEQQQQQFDKEISQNPYHNFDQHGEQSDVIVVEDDGDERDQERDYDRDHRRSRRSRDRSRSPRRRKHSRSRSRERRRSRDRHRRSRSRDHDREQQREKERERKKRGLPPLKDKHVGVCTRTLWFGHLAKHTTEDELRAAIEQYGSIDAINMIPPRGCAFVCMTRRKEAAKALDRLKGYKLNSSSLRVAWAPGIGVKESSFKDFWDVELGVAYIPWSKLPADLSLLVEGATVDEESLPEHLKGIHIGQRDIDEDGDSRSAPHSESQTPQMATPLANFPASMPGIPTSQQMHMLAPHMMVPLPSQPPPRTIPPSSQIPPHSIGQMPLLGQNHPGQGTGPPQGLAANLQTAAGGPVLSATVPISLASGVSHAQVVSVAASILGAAQNLPLNIGAMDRPGGQLVGNPGMSGINSTSALLAQSQQQPGILARPSFPPPGHLGVAAFGLPPNVPPRQGFSLPGQALRPPFPSVVENEMEEPKEWPADDSILEEEALEEMEQDTDHRVGIPPGMGAAPQGDGRGPAPLMSLPMLGMRMRLPGPGGPPRMGMPMPGLGGNGAPQAGMMVEVSQPGAAAGMAGLPVGALAAGLAGPGGMLGPRLMRPGGPQAMVGPEAAEGMIRSPMPGGLMGPQGGAAAMGLRLGMGNQGPRGIGPANMTLGQRMPGLPGSPGLRGMGPGGGPIRIVLGNQNPRGPGPGSLGVRPVGMGMDGLRPGGMQGPRNALEEMQGPGAVRSSGSQGPSEGNGLLNQGPSGLLQGLMMGAALRGGRPGLLGLRPNMPMNSGFRFGPQQPMGIAFRGVRPDFLRPPGMDKPLMDGIHGADRLGPSFSGTLAIRSLENEDKSPEYGEGFEDDDDNRENVVPKDSDFRGADKDIMINSDLRNSKAAAAAAGSISSDLAEIAKPRDRAGRQSRWSDIGSSDSSKLCEPHAETNGPALESELQSAAQVQSGSEVMTVNPTGMEGMAEG